MASLRLFIVSPAFDPLRLVGHRARVTIHPGRRNGKPCVRDLRIGVSDVLDYLAGGMTVEEVPGDFPDPTIDDIRARPAFAAHPASELRLLP